MERRGAGKEGGIRLVIYGQTVSEGTAYIKITGKLLYTVQNVYPFTRVRRLSEGIHRSFGVLIFRASSLLIFLDCG